MQGMFGGAADRNSLVHGCPLIRGFVEERLHILVRCEFPICLRTHAAANSHAFCEQTRGCHASLVGLVLIAVVHASVIARHDG